LFFKGELALRGLKIGVFGLPRPHSWSVVDETPEGISLRQNTRFKPSTIKIGSAVWVVREPKKNLKKMKNKGHQRLISGVRGGGNPVGGAMKLGTLVELPDVINHANFHLDWIIFL
jgi:hypothetical protein